MSTINIQRHALNMEHRAVEIVERKGRGHPDTLCDAVAEEVSIALSAYYRAHFGAILHHNTDKALLVGGRAHAAFGQGEIIDPMYLLLAGRATLLAGDIPIPVGEIAVEHTTSLLQRLLPHLRLPGELIVDSRIKPSSPDLVALFASSGIPLSNDTSFAVAYTPLSELELLVKSTEQYLNSAEEKQRFPQLGEDIKVMGLREGERIMLTVSVAFIAAETPDLASYIAIKQAVEQRIHELATSLATREVHVSVNSADNYAENSVYLTVTGTSAEQGDDGQVGRGNRSNGLITPMRPMTLEAAAGKNPVSHVGKIHQVYARRIVEGICAELPEVQAAECKLLSLIGTPINEPQAISVEIESEQREAVLREPITRIVTGVLDHWEEIRDGFLQRQWELF